MKKWDYCVSIIGIPEDDIDTTLDAVQQLMADQGLEVRFDLGTESEEE